MSIATEISRLQTAKADIKAAIEAKGVTVPAAAKLDTYDDYVAQISGGSGGAIVRHGEMSAISVGLNSDGKWLSASGNVHSVSYLMSAGKYTVVASSLAAIAGVVNSIGSSGSRISYSSDYPSRVVLNAYGETSFEGQAGKYLILRADTSAGAVFPTVFYEP